MSDEKMDADVMARLRAPFGCERVLGPHGRNVFGDTPPESRWRIHDANDDAIASVSGREEGYARLIVQALNGREATTALIAAVRAWARAECGATEADAVLAALAKYDDGKLAETKAVDPLERIATALETIAENTAPCEYTGGGGKTYSMSIAEALRHLAYVTEGRG